MKHEKVWPSGWLKASLRTCVLQTIRLNSGTYGHEVINLLAESGLGGIGGGTLYPILRKLSEDGLVRTEWVEGDFGPSRKIYSITKAGRTELANQSQRWLEFTAVTNNLLSETDANNE